MKLDEDGPAHLGMVNTLVCHPTSLIGLILLPIKVIGSGQVEIDLSIMVNALSAFDPTDTDINNNPAVPVGDQGYGGPQPYPRGPVFSPGLHIPRVYPL